MKKRSIVVILIIILLMIIGMSYIFILENNNDKNNNTSYNNSTNLQNKSFDKNISLNNESNNTTDNGSVDEKLNNNNYKSQPSNNDKKHEKNDSNDSYDEAMKAKLIIERNVLKKNQIAGHPVYKDSDIDAWLVPIFDKKTKKFVGSVYVCVHSNGDEFYAGFYTHGPESYSMYKKMISGKYDDKSDSSKHNEKDKSSPVKEEIPDYSERYVLASVNPEVMTNHLISNDPVDLSFENSQNFDLNQEYSTENINETI